MTLIREQTKKDENDSVAALTVKIKQQTKLFRANLVGIADLKLLENIDCQPADLLSRYRYAVSMV